ncbi:hypothetical protein [Pseudoroseicyclus tamaricis]|uniref:Uncharacterized protein n=1 Tax=Pseudoroseicyclus tamaricis TaxID=2705421 RepID=A0A6B2JNP7_9RHOB|nr:hypothetical protein [Pseudoroseicyclus tamaricis]NDU99554.1 hypothetical protein [Pseudoroseicyclus tamaricis]
MSPAYTVLMILEGLAFLAWAATMFQAVFRIRSRAVAQTRHLWPGPSAIRPALSAWARDPAERGLKLRLLVLTILLFALIAAAGLTRAAGA